MTSIIRKAPREEAHTIEYGLTGKGTMMNIFARDRRTLSSVRRLAATALAGLSVIALTACTGTGQSTTSSDTNASGSSNFPVSIKHAYGTTTIKSQPSRVSTIGWTNQDAVIALGVIPVDMPKITDGAAGSSGILPWTESALQKLGATGDKAPKLHDESDDIDTEAIASTSPDIIIGIQSGISKAQYQTMSKIAPTIAYPGKAWAAQWRQVLTLSGKALGKESEAKQVIADDEAAISKAASAHAELQGKNAAVMYFDTTKLSTVSVYTTADTRPAFLQDLGLSTPASVEKISKSTDSFYKDIAAENVDQFNDVDIIVTYGDDTTLATLQKDPLISQIPAVKRGSVVVIDLNSKLGSAIAPSALSIPSTVDDYAKVLAQAAAKVG
ncbi:MAG: iron-siderophore ABC transporter substrate-binding protein [Bifidobacterium crudilactis]|jgi:iron complex transport system substrate-binding protein|uniref:iron-siderophore ABC transporter substrate-binding protein n=1 Tax=Bifidobacterium crudilactis TaxID=327277 RepID=UPI003A5BE67B